MIGVDGVSFVGLGYMSRLDRACIKYFVRVAICESQSYVFGYPGQRCLGKGNSETRREIGHTPDEERLWIVQDNIEGYESDEENVRENKYCQDV